MSNKKTVALTKSQYQNIIDAMIEKVIDPKLTYAYRISEMVKEEGFLESHLRKVR